MHTLLTNKTIEKLKYGLVREGLVSYENLTKAEETAKENNANLAQILIQQNLISEEKLHSFIEAKLHIPYVNLDDYTLDISCLNLISYKDAKKYKIIPLFKIENILTIAMADPMDLFALNSLINSLNCKIEPIIGSERNILEAIDKHYSQDKVEIIEFNAHGDVKFNWQDELNDEAPDKSQAQRIIQAILYQSALEDIQEISFEHYENGLLVRFKKDKLIQDRGNIPVLLIPLCITKLKTMSNLDTSTSEIPQLGRIKFFVDPQDIICSVSTFPTTKGERVIIKIYKPPGKLEELCLDNDKLHLIKSCINKPGIIAVCGSNLSGKTSFIYSILSALSDKNLNIMTIESVIKYDLPSINQCELNERIGFSFDKAIKLIEFQSPDILYLEEVLSKDGFDFITSFAQASKLLITEFKADRLQSLINRFKNPDFSEMHNLISCIIFINDKNNIEILTPDQFRI